MTDRGAQPRTLDVLRHAVQGLLTEKYMNRGMGPVLGKLLQTMEEVRTAVPAQQLAEAIIAGEEAVSSQVTLAKAQLQLLNLKAERLRLQERVTGIVDRRDKEMGRAIQDTRNRLLTTIHDCFNSILSKEQQQQPKEAAAGAQKITPILKVPFSEEFERAARITKFTGTLSMKEVGALTGATSGQLEAIQREMDKEREAVRYLLEQEKTARPEEQKKEERKEDEPRPGWRTHPAVQFMFHNVFSQGVAAGAAASESLNTFAHFTNVMGAIWRQEGSVNDTIVRVYGLMQSISRLVSYLFSALQMTDLAKNMALYTSAGISNVSEFLMQWGSTIAGFKNETDEFIPTSDAHDGERIDSKATSGSMLATILGSLLWYPGRMLKPVGNFIKSAVDWFDSTKSLRTGWLLIGFGWTLLTVTLLATLSMWICSGLAMKAAWDTLLGVGYTAGYVLMELLVKMLWTQTTFLFMQKIISSPRATFVLVKSAMIPLRCIDLLIRGAGKAFKRNWSLPITIGYLTAVWKGADPNDEEVFSRITDENLRYWFRCAAVGAAFASRLGLALGALESGNYFARSVAESLVLQTQVRRTQDGTSLFIPDTNFFGFLLSGMIGSQRTIPRGANPPTSLGLGLLLRPWRLFTEPGRIIGEVTGRQLAHGASTRWLHRVSTFLKPYRPLGAQAEADWFDDVSLGSRQSHYTSMPNGFDPDYNATSASFFQTAVSGTGSVLRWFLPFTPEKLPGFMKSGQFWKDVYSLSWSAMNIVPSGIALSRLDKQPTLRQVGFRKLVLPSIIALAGTSYVYTATYGFVDNLPGMSWTTDEGVIGGIAKGAHIFIREKGASTSMSVVRYLVDKSITAGGLNALTEPLWWIITPRVGAFFNQLYDQMWRTTPIDKPPDLSQPVPTARDIRQQADATLRVPSPPRGRKITRQEEVTPGRPKELSPSQPKAKPKQRRFTREG